ncbi:NicO-domain-containing protein [Fomitiporia mediterranea MF3/22]|uniref:Nickel/cobalt efflux system n=1 Tax=Fomitiporia mediterranea (strain MF3/22) TaxID=694068 RepID=R7SH95_FOMME|nr:NicO-domain-containing protein [Fomitiporia mediterranea MF3/22]EJC97755.1 NicO-domain-containing protein [Fomitiporia mediterranea MF3/22]
MCFKWKLTLFGRSLFLIILEILANAACWIAAGIAFGRREETRGTLSLALLAWTIGLRHGLDADHISAIDNATRGLINMGQLPVTCGLFFSLGHSTIVIVVNVAIAISTSVYDKISGVGDIGGIVGAAVSGSFLFIIGLANSIILYRIIRNRRRRRRQEDAGIIAYEDNPAEKSIMMQIIGPVTTFVNKPWKMYPVGVLFGFGFDTASSIALLAVTALAEKSASGKGIPRADIIILPLLFTAGMTLVDSADSILMLYAYAGVPDRALSLFELRIQDEVSEETSKSPTPDTSNPVSPDTAHSQASDPLVKKTNVHDSGADIEEAVPSLHEGAVDRNEPDTPMTRRSLRVKQHTMSGLSIALTLISILVAFSISFITIMGLIGENCVPCQRAANAPDGGGLAGSWWRGWEKANDASGFIGAAIVGGFILVLAGWYIGLWALRKMKLRMGLRG